MLRPMRAIHQMLAAEIKMRELLEREGLPEPDSVEYGQQCVNFVWLDERLVVEIDITE